MATFTDSDIVPPPQKFTDDDVLTPENLPSREEFEASHKAAVGSWWEQLKAAAGLAPTVLSGLTKKSSEIANTPLVPESVTSGLPTIKPPRAGDTGPATLEPWKPQSVPGAVAHGAAEFARGMTSPENIGLAALMAPVARIAPLLSRAVSGGFGVQMLKGAYDQVPEVRDAIEKKDWPRAASALTTAVLSGGLGAVAGSHAVRGAPGSVPGPSETPRPAASPVPETPPGSQPATVPETPETIRTQIQQLTSGDRKTVMLPNGTAVPPLPPTMRRWDTDDGTFIYNPKQLTPRQIEAARSQNRLPEILGAADGGLGAPDKSQLQGEPITVVARDANGTEVQSTATDANNLARTLEQSRKIQPANGTVRIEPAENVIAERRAALTPSRFTDADIAEPGAESAKQSKAAPGESIDTIRGSRDVPLAPQGRQEAQQMAQANAGQFDRIESSTLSRARETADTIAGTNPQAGEVVPNENITPWYLGQHEGQPSAQRAAQIADLVKNRPDEVPDGRHEESTKDGQSFNDFKGDVLGDLNDTIEGYQPGQKILKLTHGRVVQLVRAYAAKGMPEDGSIDTNLMTSKWLTPPAGMIRVDPESRTVEDAQVADKPGIYYGRHGATEDNAENRGGAPASAALATGKEQPVVLQDFVAGRGGFAEPARMVVPSGRNVSADEIRQAFFPELGPDRLEIQKLRADDFMSAMQPGRQPFRLQFMDERGRHTSAPPGIEERLGLGAGENYHAPRPAEAAAAQPERPAARQLREPSTPPVYGREASIAVPGERTSYPARYAVRELADVQASHNPFNFEPNAKYDYSNDRDYSRTGNAARVVAQSAADTFNPEFPTTDSPTAEHGAPIIDASGNVLGGNSRTMTLARVYQRGGPDAETYRAAIRSRAAQFGIDPADVDRFQKPVLVRELGGGVDAQRAITDFNKSAPAELAPDERAVSDGRRLSSQTVQEIAARIEDSGEGGTLADALRGEDGAGVVNSLVRDGVLTEQEKGGYLDDRGFLTPEAKGRISRALVGRLFETPAEFRETTPEMRAKLERVAPQLLRVEGRPEWELTDQTKEAVGLVEDARVHKQPIDDLARQSVIGADRRYSPDAIEIAKTLQQSPTKAAAAFRRYANDEALSREGGQSAMFQPPTRTEAFDDAFRVDNTVNRLFGDEQGKGPIFTHLADYITSKVHGEGPKQNYSGLGAFKDKYVRNLSQLEEVSPKAHLAAVQTATSRAQTTVLLRSAVPQIEKALGENGPNWEDLRTAMIESRLQGIRARWRNLEGQVRIATPGQLKTAFDNGLMQILEHIEGVQGIPQDVSQTAATMLHNADQGDLPSFTGLREFLRGVFSQAGDRVARMMPGEDFERLIANPAFKRGLAAYKELIEKPIAASHERNEGIFSDALGPLKTYYPLVPLTEGEAFRSRAGASQPAPYRKPANSSNDFAGGLAAEYNTSTEALANRIARSFKANNKAALIQTLQDEGLAKVLQPGARVPPTVNVGGVDYASAVVETRAGRQSLEEGKAKYVPAQAMVMPVWLKAELDPILQQTQLGHGTGLKFAASVINRIALSGPVDFALHSANLMGTAVANTPFLRDSLMGKASSFPIVKKFAAMAKVIGTDPTTKEAVDDLQEMAHLGLLPERYGSQTFSRLVAEETGAEHHRASFGPALYGPKGIDVRARLMMFRLAKEINPNATPLDHYKFVNQLGNYTESLQGSVERAMKSTGFSPFYTAGSTMLRNGLNAWLGTGPMPASGPGLRVAQQLSGGGVGVLGAWVLAHLAMRGQLPWDDKESKFLQIRATPAMRRSALGRELWGSGPEEGYVNLAFFNPLVARGARALGIAGAYDTARAGGSAQQSAEAAATGTMNAVLHPIMGPPARALFAGITGNETLITGLRDRQSKPGLQFLPATPPGTSNFPHLGASFREMNQFYANLGAATGFHSVAPAFPEKGNRWLRMVTDLALPQLVSRPSNPAAKTRVLQQQESAGRKAAAKAVAP